MSNAYRKLFPIYQMVTTEDDDNGYIEITIKEGPLPTDEVTIGNIDIYRAGVKVTDAASIIYDKNTGILTITEAGTYVATLGDEVHGCWTFRKE